MNAKAVFLQALFEPLAHQDGEAIQAVLASTTVLDQASQEAFKNYVADPVGVRSWSLNERVFFVGDSFPFVSPRAMLRLREARVASAYGLREEAVEVVRSQLRMPEARLAQIERALQVYEEGIKRAFAEDESSTPATPEPELQEPVVEAVASPPASPVAPSATPPDAKARSTRSTKKTAPKKAAPPAKKKSSVKPQRKGKTVSAST